MTKDVIEMPQNDESYHRKARIAIDNKEYQLASEYLEKSLDSEFNLPVFNELVNLYLLLGEKDKLLAKWDELDVAEENIFKLDPLALAYLSSLKYMKSRSDLLILLYHAKINYQMSPAIKKAVEEYIDYLEKQNLLEKEIEVLSDNDDYDKWYELWLKNTPKEQLEILKGLYGLSFDLTEPIYKRILADENVLQFIKSDVLHALIYRDISAEFALNWGGDNYDIQTDNLVPYTEQSIYKNLVAEIEKYAAQENPQLFEALIQQINLQLMVLYPFADRVITQPTEWLNIMLDDYQLIDHTDSARDDDLYSKYQLVLLELTTLMS